MSMVVASDDCDTTDEARILVNSHFVKQVQDEIHSLHQKMDKLTQSVESLLMQIEITNERIQNLKTRKHEPFPFVPTHSNPSFSSIFFPTVQGFKTTAPLIPKNINPVPLN